jgi:hypothetical protein
MKKTMRDPQSIPNGVEPEREEERACVGKVRRETGEGDSRNVKRTANPGTPVY